MKTWHKTRRASAVAVVTVAWICGGCGNARVPISGNVTFNGKPVDKGVITLEPADRNGPTTGGEIVDGKFKLIGNAAPLPGKKIVRISAVRKTGRKVPAGMPLPPGSMVDELEHYIPPIYDAKSNMTCEVSPDGSKEIDFALKSP